MTFKIHLIIVSFIIVIVYVTWQLMSSHVRTASTPTQTESQYSISIIHASWGLNCKNINTDNNATSYEGYAATGTTTKDMLRADNALAKVSELCNGKLQCSITVKADAIGFDPAPTCQDKLLEVDYRCFSYDRPWNIKASNGALNIDCDKASRPK